MRGSTLLPGLYSIMGYSNYGKLLVPSWQVVIEFIERSVPLLLRYFSLSWPGILFSSPTVDVMDIKSIGGCSSLGVVPCPFCP